MKLKKSLALLLHTLFPRTMMSLRFYHTCKLTSQPSSWVLQKAWDFWIRQNHSFGFGSVLLDPNAQGANVKRPRWIWEHIRFASQLRNSKLKKPKVFITGCKQTCLTFALKETLSQSCKIILYTNVLEMKCLEPKNS